MIDVREATYLDVINYLHKNNHLTYQVTNSDVYDFLDWVDDNIFEPEPLDGAWRRYNSVDFQGDCV